MKTCTAQKWLRSSILSIFFILIALPADNCHAASTINLANMDWRFMDGDNAVWSTSTFDHDHWQRVNIPGELRSQGFLKNDLIGWYRLSINIDELPISTDAILLGVITGAEEVFVNGEKIGGRGKIHHRGSLLSYHGGDYARLYTIPENILSKNHPISLAVRIQNPLAGISQGPLLLGNSKILTTHVEKINFKRQLRIGITAICALITLLGALVYLFVPIRRTEFGYFTLMMTSLVAYYATLLPLSFRAWVVVPELISVLSPILVRRHLYAMYDLPENILGRIFDGTIVVSTILFYIPNSASLAYLGAIIWFSCIGLSGIYSTVISFYAAQRGYSTAYLIIFAHISIIVMQLVGSYSPFHISGVLYEYGDSIFILSYTLAFAIRLRGFFTHYLSLSEKLINTLEDERRRISRDLHDSLGQYLTNIKLGLQMAHFDKNIEKLPDITNQIGQSLDELYRVIHNLRPVIFDNDALSKTLRHLVESFNSNSTVTIHYHGQETHLPISKTVSQHLYRIVQEAMHNAIKHANADTINVIFTVSNSKIQLTIRDNGIGLPKPVLRNKTGFGLESMQERAKLLDARLTIDSNKHGTVIDVELSVRSIEGLLVRAR